MDGMATSKVSSAPVSSVTLALVGINCCEAVNLCTERESVAILIGSVLRI